MEEHSKFWIERNRFFELKYFCLQYDSLNDRAQSMIDRSIERLGEEAPFIFLAVTTGANFEKLNEEYGDLNKDKFFDAYRKFFWLLDKKRK